MEGRSSIVDLPGDLGRKDPRVVEWQAEPALIEWFKNEEVQGSVA